MIVNIVKPSSPDCSESQFSIKFIKGPGNDRRIGPDDLNPPHTVISDSELKLTLDWSLPFVVFDRDGLDRVRDVIAQEDSWIGGLDSILLVGRHYLYFDSSPVLVGEGLSHGRHAPKIVLVEPQ